MEIKMFRVAFLLLLLFPAAGCSGPNTPQATLEAPIPTATAPPFAPYQTPEEPPKPDPVSPLVKGERFTARQGLALAEEEAAKVQPDAHVRACFATQVSEDGKAEEWTYVFWSPAGRQDVKTTIRLGETTGSQTENTTLDLWHQMASMGKWAVDSPRAIKIALEKGLKEELDKLPGHPGIFDLKIELAHGSLAWEIKAGGGNIFPYYVNGETGEFIDFDRPKK